MNKKILLTVAVAGTIVAGFAAKKDPVVMKVAGRDVPRSEFEYLYHKNANQQRNPLTIEEYADMFKLYKQKVAAALDEGIDTTKAFKDEYAGYLVDLRAPYCVDSVYVKELMNEIYDRMQTEVKANHIMLKKPRGLQDTKRDIYSIADSLHKELLAGADFADLAERFSDDAESGKHGGFMGWITTLMTPYEFENAVYQTSEGAISDIIETDFGYHIIKGGERRPARGEVLVEHILRFVPPTATPEQREEIKAQMDSIYNVLKDQPDSFETLATQYSEDKASARMGGKLNWFGVGRMVPEFDSVAFSLSTGAISEPFSTDYGYHIIKKLDSRGIPSYDEALPRLQHAMENRQDTRGRFKAKQFAEKLRKKYGLKSDKGIRTQMMEYAAANGLNSDFIEHFKPLADKPFMSFAGNKYTVADFLEHLEHFRNEGYPSVGKKELATRIENFEQQELYFYYFKQLPEENIDFRNITNEYRDGMLLFEISNRRVWDKSVKDTEGLKKFFEQNRADYTWKSPRVKGILVQAADDSIATQVKAMLDSVPAAEGVANVRKEFPGKVKADRILMAKGDNELVDALVFGDSLAENPDSKYPVYFLYNFSVIDAPEDVEDVKAQVTADYHEYLEAEWEEELQNKYPVIIYEKELKKIK